MTRPSGRELSHTVVGDEAQLSIAKKRMPIRINVFNLNFFLLLGGN
jgi:hypothetical protein